MNPLHALWRRLPASQRREALFSVMSFLAPPLPDPEPLGAGEITVAGYFGAPSGLGEGVRRLADMLEAAGAVVHRADLSSALRQSPDQAGRRPVPPGPGTLLMHVNGPLLPWGLFALGRRVVAQKRILAVWNWELPSVPRDWDRGFRHIHGILCTSRFVQAAMERAGGPPTAVIHYPIPRPQLSRLTRAELGLSDAAFVSLCLFDASSVVERKNPLGAVSAHLAAFGDDSNKILVIKTYNTLMAGPGWQEVLDAVRGHANIRLIDRKMSREDVWSLVSMCDVFVSLHRSEGVGLAPLEAMRLGRAVLATGWSGNMDFMDDTNAALVPYSLVPALDSRGVYSVKGGTWAEPDIAAASRLLQRLASDSGWRAALGRAAMVRASALEEVPCGAQTLRAMASLGRANSDGAPRSHDLQTA